MPKFELTFEKTVVKKGFVTITADNLVEAKQLAESMSPSKDWESLVPSDIVWEREEDDSEPICIAIGRKD